MSADDEDLPQWAKPLVRGPVVISAATSEKDLAKELEERLDALLQWHNCDATDQGWRELALRLALKHEPCMKVITPADRMPDASTGAEPGKRYWTALRLKKKERELKSGKLAAIAIANSPLEVRSLQTLLSEAKKGRVPKPRFMQRLPWEAKINAALRRATSALEERSRF